MSWRKNSIPPVKEVYGLPAPVTPPNGAQRKKLRIVASGTLFMTHTLTVPPSRSSHVGFPPNTEEDDDALFSSVNLRAQSVTKSRGGSAATVLSILCQFANLGTATLRPRAESQAGYLRPGPREPDAEAWLVAPIGRGSEASSILGDLEKEGVKTKLCLRREGEGVPCAYIIKTIVELPSAKPEVPGRTNGNVEKIKRQTRVKRTVINYNPISDLTHEEFIRLLAPLLYPTSPITGSAGSSSPTGRSPTSPEGRFSSDEGVYFLSPDPPFDWLHFEGRTAQTTLSNMTGLDGFAKERGWRSKLVFSLDCSRVGRQGQEALIPHADVVFFSKAYAQSLSFTSPRAFLLAQALRSAPHALLIVSWADQGSALLSVPTREYLQSSSFVTERDEGDDGEFESVRSSTILGSVSVESGTGHTSTSSGNMSPRTPNWGANAKIRRRKDRSAHDDDDEDDDEDDDTETADDYNDVIDESGADDAFVAGMIYSLSRRLLPSPLYSPFISKPPQQDPELERGRWRLEECLRFATEMAGRKVRRKGFSGLARAMENVGWFQDT